MSLQIWLPLNGSLENKGLTNTSLAAASLTYSETGKVTAHCGYFNTTHINIPDTNSILTTNSYFSIAFWAKLSDTQGKYYTLFCDRTTVGKGVAIFYNPTIGGFRFDTGDSQTIFPANTSYSSWTHFCFTFNGEKKCLYINGVKQADPDNANYNGQLVDIGSSILIGKETTTDPSHPLLTSYLNDFRIYNHCLSPREVKLLAQGLVAHYKLDGNEVENPNLVNDSYGDYTSGEYLIHTYTFDRAGFGRYLTAGEKCTLTVCFTPAADFGYFNPHINSGARGEWMPNIYSNGTTNRQIATVVSENNWVYSNGSNHNINPEDEPARADVCMYHRKDPNNAGSSGTTIHWIKLQLGKHPAAKTWTPSISENPNQYLLEDDCSGYDNHGTCSSPFGLTSDAPRYKNCKNFENNKYIKCPTRSYPGMKDTYTFSYWARHGTDTSMDGKMIWGFYDGGYLDVYPSGGYLTWNTGDGGTNLFKDNGISIPYPTDGLWHHYAFTGNGSQTLLYIDGNYKGQAITYRSIPNSGTLFLSGWNTNENQYRWNGGQISDFRLYATTLSAAAVKELSQSSISFLDNGILQCSEIVESPTNLKYSQNGITQAELISEVGYTNKMKIKTLSDGSAWARIHWLDVSSNPKNSSLYFTGGANEVTYCVNQSNRFSLMCYVDKFKTVNNNYEFMLTYPRELSGYNRWTQTSSANSGSVSGLVKITTAWDAHNYGIRKDGSSSLYNCDAGDTWYASIGQYGIWDSANNLYIPNANGTNSTEVELWVRIDNLPKLTKLSMLDDAIQAYQIYEL